MFIKLFRNSIVKSFVNFIVNINIDNNEEQQDVLNNKKVILFE